MKLFEADMALKLRWVLGIDEAFGDGSPVDVWAYTRCKTIANPNPVPFHIDADGLRVDFNPTAFGTLVVSSKMAAIVEAVSGSDIQRVPALVRGDAGSWEILNILSAVDCIDHERSSIQYYPLDHPEKPGKPRGIAKLIIDPLKISGHHIFRPVDWRFATIVSETLRTELEKNRIEGIEYCPVTADDC